MTRRSIGLDSSTANDSAIPVCFDEARIATVQEYSSHDAEEKLCPSDSVSKTNPQPTKTSITSEHAVNAAPTVAVSHPSLPYQFVDQQQLRLSSGSNLRRVVRSHARRNFDLKRKQLKATLSTRSPRPLKKKDSQITEPVTATHRKDVVHEAASVSHIGAAGSLVATLRRCPVTDTPEHSELQPRTYICSSPSDGENQLNHGLLSRRQHEVRSVTQHLEKTAKSGKQTTQSLKWAHSRNSHATISHGWNDDLKYGDQNFAETAGVVRSLVQGSWRHDPFDSFSHLNSPRSSLLLSHYNRILGTVWVSEKLVSFQTSKLGLLHATFLFTATYLRALTKSNQWDKDIFHHKGETIRIINSSLDDASKQTSDEIIAALSSLILYEETYGCKHIASIHRQGLQQILKLRYAKPDLGIHRFVHHLLAHPSSASASTTERPEGRTLHGNAGNDTPPESTLAEDKPATYRSTPLGRAVTSSFLWLTNTAIELESASYKSEDINQIQQDIEEFLELCPNYPRSKMTFPFRTWLLTAMIYLHTAMVQPSDGYLLPRNEADIVAQLKCVMYNSKSDVWATKTTSASSPRLWVLMLNGLYERSNDRVLLGSPKTLDPNTVSSLHWCRAQLLLRDIPWAERLWKDEPLEDKLEWVRSSSVWHESFSRWSNQF